MSASFHLRSVMFACLAVLAFPLVAVEIDGVTAKVDSEVILRSDVIQEMRRVGADESRFTEIRNAMIERQLILKAAAASKMQMQDWVVENRLQEIVNRAFGGDRNRLMETLARDRISYPEWRQRMKDDMVVGAMRWQMVDKNVSPSPADLRREYEAHPERYSEGGKVTVSVILLRPEDKDRRDEVGAALREKDFAEVAKTYSADSRAADGGVWKNVVARDVFKPEVCEEIDKMPKGTMSHWIEIGGWSFLLRKDDEISPQRRSFVEAYDDIDANVREELAKRLYTDWIDRLKSESYIKTY